MKNISSAVEKAIRKYTDLPELNYSLANNLEFRLVAPIDPTKPFKEAKKIFLKNYLNDLLVLSLGNISLAAKKANINRRHMHRIINELHLNPETHRKDLLKPSEYLKGNIQTILEDTLSGFDEKGGNLSLVYSNMADITEIIAKDIEHALSFSEAVELFEKEFLARALKDNEYNIERTADAIDMSERTLYRKISKFNLATA